MQDAHGKQSAAPRLHVDVERRRGHFAGLGFWNLKLEQAFRRDHVGHRQRADVKLREVVVEPLRERRVEMEDRAVGVGRKKAGWRVVEIVDGALQILKKRLVARPLARDVGNRPQHPRVGLFAQRREPHAIPRGAGAARQAADSAAIPRCRSGARGRLARAGTPTRKLRATRRTGARPGANRLPLPPQRRR